MNSLPDSSLVLLSFFVVRLFLLGALTAVTALSCFALSQYYSFNLQNIFSVVITLFALIFGVITFLPLYQHRGSLNEYLLSLEQIDPLYGILLSAGILICLLVSLVLTAAYNVETGINKKNPVIRKLSVKEDQKAVLLTFDDGPSSQWTPPILEILKQEQCKAVFFVTGKGAEENSSLIKDLHDAGMEIGVHSYFHLPLPLLSTKSIEREIKETAVVIEKATGKKPKYFRPPWGLFNKQVLNTASKYGLKTMLWSSSSQDWRLKNSDKIVKTALKKLDSGGILLFHDGCKKKASRKPTVEALPHVIKQLEESGFTLVLELPEE